MPLFSNKRRRSYEKEGLAPTSLLARWVPRVFRERAIFIPACIGAVAVLLLVFTVEAWRTVFPYQVGSRLDHAIHSRVEFRRLNRSLTEKTKDEAAERVHPIFVNDPARLQNLPGRLRTGLQTIAGAKSLKDDVPKPVQNAFGLTSSDRKPKTDAQIQQDFRRFQSLISTEQGKTADRIKTLVSEFERFIQPLKRFGRADPAAVAQRDLQVDDPVTVVTTVEGRRQRIDAYRTDILLEEALKESGRLATQWNRYPNLLAIRDYLTEWLLSQTPVTLNYDEESTKLARRKARADADPVYDRYEENQELLSAGQTINEETLAVLRAEYEAFERQIPPVQRLGRVVTVVVLLLLLAVLVGHYLIRNERSLVRSPLRLTIYLGALVIAVALGRLFVTGGWRAEIIPLIATVMIFAVAYNQRLGLLTSLALSLMIALSTTASLTHFVVLLSVSSAAVVPLSQVPSRSALIKVGFWSAAVYFVMSWSSEIVWNRTLYSGWADTDLLLTSLRGAGCCLVAGYLVAGSLPFVESAFGIVTDISLLEMSDVSHPLLQELARRAPGTYNHSISVATIGEAAADAIGANGLLVRVGAYFHDIGKMLKPEYFVENMTEGSESRHKKLAPAMSTLIIIGHVKDGVDLARQHNLPESLIDFIEQHHGTTLVEYFYHAATKQAEAQPDHKTDAEESSFRYPGPKPQTKEAGVMMLADAVESASRALSDPTPKRIESLVKSISMKRLLDDQLDESSLTLSEIRAVEDSLIKSLIAVYHGRIKYPQQRTA